MRRSPTGARTKDQEIKNWRTFPILLSYGPPSLAATVPVLAGMFVGQYVRGRLSDARFSKALALVLLAIGLSLIRKAFV